MKEKKETYTFVEAFNKVDELRAIENTSMSDYVIKMQEEVGEIAESHLMITGYKPMKNPVSKNKATQINHEKEHLAEEAVDSIIVGMAILSANGTSQQKIEELLKQKIDKWVSKLVVKKKIKK